MLQNGATLTHPSGVGTVVARVALFWHQITLVDHEVDIGEAWKVHEGGTTGSNVSWSLDCVLSWIPHQHLGILIKSLSDSNQRKSGRVFDQVSNSDVSHISLPVNED